MTGLASDLQSRESRKFAKDGSIMITGSEMTIRMAYDGSNNLEYVGIAEIGSATSDAVWQIKKLTYSGSNLTSVLWADSDANKDNIWDNRASLTYG